MGWGGFAPGMSRVPAKPPSSSPRTGTFCTSRGSRSPAVPHSWHPEGGIPVSHMSATPTGAACLPAPPLLCKQPGAFASPGAVASESGGGSSQLAGARVAEPCGTAELPPQRLCPSRLAPTSWGVL